MSSRRRSLAVLWLLVATMVGMGAIARDAVPAGVRAQARPAWRSTATWIWQTAPPMPTETPRPSRSRIPQTRQVVTATPVGTVTPTSIYLWPTITPEVEPIW